MPSSIKGEGETSTLLAAENFCQDNFRIFGM